MEGKEPTREELAAENEALKERLLEAEQTIKAIRGGEVDALVISEAGEERIFTLKGADLGYRILVESINEGALVFALDDSIYYCNHCFGEMIQSPIQKIIGTTLNSYIDRKAQAEITELIRESRSCGKAKGEFLLQRADGTPLPVNVSFNCVEFDNFKGVCAVVTDLSRQKQTEDELKSYAARLEALNGELQEFAFIASHDLQEPLRKIQSFGNMLAKRCTDNLDETARDYLTRMQNSASRMRQLIHDLLKYSRLATRAEPLDKVDLRNAVVDVISDLGLNIGRTGAAVDISDLPTIEAEPSQMRQLFQNLIANALKFRSEEKPHIRVYSRRNDHEWQIFVEDNGIGFDEQFLDRIFKPFQRLHGRSLYDGTGMGLAICRKIVERHGGKITARSTPGKGSTFIVTLPENRGGVGI